MKVVLNGVKIVEQFFKPQGYQKALKYRKSFFCESLKQGDVFLIMNTLTRQMIELSQKEFEGYENGEDFTDDLFLTKNRFLVPQKHDDFELCNQVLSLAKMFVVKGEITQYTIFPTMECNARCFYCFEHGAKRYPMTNKTAKDVAEFIAKESKGKKISLQWFGGEPLYNMSAIDIIVNNLTAKGILFESRMITNGYLFDEAIVLKAKNDWKIQMVQITLDGTEKTYNKVKNYIYNNEISPFEKVIYNIELLAKNKIQVLIRLNLDKYNESDLNRLIEYLFYRFDNLKEYISIYAWLLYDNRGINQSIKSIKQKQELTDKLIEIEQKIEDSGFSLKDKPYSKIRTSACMADNDSAVVILPNGNLGRCDHHSDDEFYGSIYSEKLDKDVLMSWKELRKPVEICRECSLYPQCHNLKKCKDVGFYDCDETLQRQRLHGLHRQMRNAYKEYLKVTKNDI